MSDNLTENLSTRSFEERVLAQLAAFSQELAATRQDFNSQLAAVRQEIASVRQETTEQFAAVRQEFAGVRQEFVAVREEFTAVRQEIKSVRQELAEQREMIVHLHDRVVSVETRLTALDEKVEARLHDTRPIWEGVQARLAGIETEQKSLGRQFRSLAADIFGLRVRVDKLEGESV